MTRWGLAVMSIGSIVMVYSQTYDDFSTKMMYCIGGLVMIGIGAMIVWRNKKSAKKK